MANLVPLFGVLALGWNVTPIMIFYWSENLVVGFYNVLKMRRAQGSVAGSNTTLNGRQVAQTDRRAMIAFFMSHKKLWISLRTDNEGRSELTIGGTANKNREAFSKEMEQMIQSLKEVS